MSGGMGSERKRCVWYGSSYGIYCRCALIQGWGGESVDGME